MPLARVNGAELFYEEFGTGAPLLIVHGMLETGRTYAKATLACSTQYHVLVPDLRGYGRSLPRPRTFPPDFYARDAADLAALLRHLRLTDVRVIGNGDGAEVALLLAAAAPELIGAVIAVDVSGAFPQALLEILPEIGNWVDDPQTPNLARRTTAIREYGLEGTQAIWAGWKQAVRQIIAAGGNVSLEQARTIRCPVLIVNHDDDPLNTPAMSRRLRDAIPNAELDLLTNIDPRTFDAHFYWYTPHVQTWLAAH
jgi:valacyclovir hydrolase